VPLIDAFGIIGAMWLIGSQYQVSTGIIWPRHLLQYALAAYSFTWLICLWICGGYDRPLKLISVFKGIGLGTALILITYGLLPKDMQFSRFFILFSALAACFWIIALRLLLTLLKIKPYVLSQKMTRNLVIVGKPDEANRVKEMIRQSSIRADAVYTVAPSQESNRQDYDAHVSQLNEFIYNHKISEVIFCARDNSAGEIMGQMSFVKNPEVDFRIAQPDSAFIIGSSSVNTTCETYSLDILSIQSAEAKRTKRIIDFSFAFLFLLLSPLLFLLVKNKGGFFRNIFLILINKKSFVGQDVTGIHVQKSVFKACIIPCTAHYNKEALSLAAREKINFLYTRDYKPMADIRLIFRQFSQLGR
jgi:hypothetical protein